MLKVTLIKSTIGATKSVKATVEALGLKKIRSERVVEDNAQVRGMLAKVAHLVKVENV